MWRLFLAVGAVAPSLLAEAAAATSVTPSAEAHSLCAADGSQSDCAISEATAADVFAAGEKQSFSMLQRAALTSRQVSTKARHTGPPADGPSESAPTKMTYRGVDMLCMQFSVLTKLRDLATSGGLFGEVINGTFKLDPEGFVLVTVAQYPDAQLGWTGTFEESSPVNLPHTLISVKVPLLQGSKNIYQTEYALINDDVAMNMYRMGYGVPAKLANISLSAGRTPSEATAITAKRRGHNLLHIGEISAAGASDAEQVAALFDRPEVIAPTGMVHNLLPNLPVLYHKHITSASILSASKVEVGSVAVGQSAMESLHVLLQSSRPLAAWRIQADLVITSSLVSFPRPKNGSSMSSRPEMFAWRNGGDVLTPNTWDPHRFPLMTYQNGDVVWVNVKLNNEEVTRNLPPGVALAGDEGLIWNVRWSPTDVTDDWGMSGDFPIQEVLEYNELWVTVPVKWNGARYMYPLLMLLDEDVAQMMGRDGMGCPKKLANLTFTFQPKPQDGATFQLNISRHGRKVLNLGGRLTEPTGDRVFGVNANQKPGSGTLWLNTQEYEWDPELYRPIWMPMESYERTYQQNGLSDISLDLGTGTPEPMGRWFEGPALRGGYVKMDQDWGPTPAAFSVTQARAEGLQDWWKRTFPVLYM